MSGQARPISPHSFALAIRDLPLSNLHNKAAELQNSIIYLERSISQLREFADGGDADCAEAIGENLIVIDRQRDRIRLLKEEVEGRGMAWVEPSAAVNGDTTGSGEPATGDHSGTVDESSASRATDGRASQPGGGLSDEELARRLRERMDDEEGGGDGDGVHL